MPQEKSVFCCSHCGYVDISDKNDLLLLSFQSSGDKRAQSHPKHIQSYCMIKWQNTEIRELKCDIWYLSFHKQSVLPIQCKHYHYIK